MILGTMIHLNYVNWSSKNEFWFHDNLFFHYFSNCFWQFFGVHSSVSCCISSFHFYFLGNVVENKKNEQNIKTYFTYSKASINAVFCARKCPRCSKTLIRRLKLCNGVQNCQKIRVLRGYCSLANVPRWASKYGFPYSTWSVVISSDL